MVRRVLLLRQLPRRHHRHRHRIPKNHLYRRRRHWREIERAELPLQRQMDIHITDSGEQALLRRRDGDEISALGPRAGDEAEELVGVAGLAEEDEEVGGREDADVAVEGVDGGEEGGANAKGDEGLGDLLGDESGLADAGEEDGAGGVEEGLGKG